LECFLVKTATYGEFSTHIHERHRGRRAPVEVSLEVTHRCPLDCQHCYNNLPMSDQQARKSELSREEYARLFDELVEAGCLWICFTGGEVFARKDFLEIYTLAKKKGFLITLFTNGTLITPRVADHLAEYRPFSIEITLYGATREIYEELTRVPGSFDRCMNGIRLLLERGLPLKLKTVPTTVNYHEVYEMKRFAEEDLGVEFKFDPLVNPRTDCSQSPLNVRLTPEQAVALEFRDPARMAEYRKLFEQEQALAQIAMPARRYTCGGGHSGCAVDPGGRMTICVLSHKNGYDIRGGSFQAGWDGPLQEIRELPATRKTICTDCQIRSLCSMCAANGELENGDAEAPVDFLCQVAHLRAFSIGISVPEHGDCVCCPGGSQHAELMKASHRLQQNARDAQGFAPIERPPSLLPVLESHGGCSSGGCSSCRSPYR
jgi:radical SAM protein with 4Fe4S-binding SPASM domain